MPLVQEVHAIWKQHRLNQESSKEDDSSNNDNDSQQPTLTNSSGNKQGTKKLEKLSSFECF